MKYLMIAAALNLFTFNLKADNHKNHKTPQVREFKNLAHLKDVTRKIASEELACKEDSDCVVFPVGHRACGGPQEYFISSKKNEHFKEVQKLTETTQSLERKLNVKYKVVSTCVFAVKPDVGCDSSHLCSVR